MSVARPHFHFTPPQGWMNDPNGLVFHDGEWHLFYQHHPHSTVWGPMHWGHAVSADLVHWQHLPIALAPQDDGYVFSGSAVVTAGGALAALYTNHDMAAERADRRDVESQHLATSRDRGRTWTRHAANPVLPNPGDTRDFRDPKVFWHAPTERWVMALAAGDHAQFWGSSDLLRWSPLSRFGPLPGVGVWECPDLFELDDRWVLLISLTIGGPNGGSGTRYLVGDFDGQRFVPAAGFPIDTPVWLDHGRDHYAGITWSGTPRGERVLIAWMNNWQYARQVPAADWRGTMSLPVALSLGDDLRLRTRPVEALRALRQGSAAWDAWSTVADAPAPCEIEFEIEPAAGTEAFGIELGNALGDLYRVGFDVRGRSFFSDRTRGGDRAFSPDFAAGRHAAPRRATAKAVRLHLFIDTHSVELFADDGSVQMTELVFPTQPWSHARLFCDGAAALLRAGRWHRLVSAPPSPARSP